MQPKTTTSVSLNHTTLFDPRIVAIALTAIALIVSVNTATSAEKTPIRIGVLARESIHQCREKWEPTIDYLNQEISEHSFLIVPLTYNDILHTIEQGKVDFALTNPAVYVEIESLYGAKHLATLKNGNPKHVHTVYAGVIICKATRRDINHVDDLRNKTFMAVDEYAFGGWLATWRELKEKNIHPKRDFAELQFGGTHDAVVYAVRDGKVDAGTVRTNTLERMHQQGKIQREDFRVINEHINDKRQMPFAYSTRLYPEWAFSTVAHTPHKLAESVTIALLKMPSDSNAAKTGEYAGWTVPASYQPVHECLKYLRVGPYKNFGKVTFRSVLNQYRYWIAAVSALVIIMALTTAHMLRLYRCLVRIRKYLENELSERKQNEDRLRTAHKKNELLLSAISSALIVMDKDMIITEWNERAEHLTGLATKDALGQQINNFAIKWNSDILGPAMAECLIRKKPVHRTENLWLICMDGTKRYFEFILTPVMGHGDRPSGFLMNVTDITERKSLEIQLVHAQKLESIGQLAAGIAHEINTPTQYVGDNTRFLQESFEEVIRLHGKYQRLLEADRNIPLPPELIAEIEAAAQHADIEYLAEEIPKAIEQSLEGIERVTSIVRAMKEFSHPNAKEKTAVNLNKEIKNTITVCRNEWKYVANMVTDLAANLPLVSCLPGDLNQVFLNMIVNAAHAIADALGNTSSEKGTITVSTRQNNNSVEVRITDTGTGIPENVRTRIFDPFFTTKEVGKGTGQGLAIAHAVVTEKHSGTITIESEIGKGTTFIIALPLGSHSE